MKYSFWVLLFLSQVVLAQSADGNGKTATAKPVNLHLTQFAKANRITRYVPGEKDKFKKDQPVRFFQWANYKKDDTVRRFRREYDVEMFLYEEHFVSQRAPGQYKTVRHYGSDIAFEALTERGNWYVYDMAAKVYDQGVLQATIFFADGRPNKIYINHYYANGQLQFTRKITSEGTGKPLINEGVLEAYYPDGRVFENVLTEDGNAVIILDDNGEEMDQCDCIGDDIMQWGAGYLYPFIGKYYYLLQHIYEMDKLECCWE